MLLTYNVELETPYKNVRISLYLSLPTMAEAKAKLSEIYAAYKTAGFKPHWVEPNVFSYIDESTDESTFISITETKTNTFTNQQVRGI